MACALRFLGVPLSVLISRVRTECSPGTRPTQANRQTPRHQQISSGPRRCCNDCPAPALSSDHTANTGPSKHKPAQCFGKQTTTNPDLSPRTASLIPSCTVLIQTPRSTRPGKVLLRRGVCEQEIEKCGDQQVGEQVEAKALQRFETEDTGSNAEEEARDRSNIGERLENKSLARLAP